MNDGSGQAACRAAKGFPGRLNGVLCSLLLISQVVADDAVPHRFEKDIQALEKKIQSGQTPSGAVLFVGSSSIRLWKLEQSFPGKTLVNHGFGGSELADSVHFFDRIVTPVKPKTIVVYAGDNDISKGATAERVLSDFQQLVGRTRKSLPAETTVVFISIKPSLKRWALAEEMTKANQQIAAWCQQQRGVRFVDVWQPMLNAQGLPQPGLFVKDGLHLNDDGYKIWTSELAKALPELASR